MGKGTLSVKVFDANNDKPLSGAQVKIKDHTNTILHDLKTGAAGTTKNIILEAIDRTYSLDPSFTGHPYSTYGLEAHKGGYNSLHIADVQIFDGEQAVQSVPLTPMSAQQQGPTQEERTIGRIAIERNGHPHPQSVAVQAGDTLWSLSRRFNTSVAAIQNLNNLTGDQIRIGQILTIPQA